MGQHRRKRPGSRPNGCNSSGRSSKSFAFWSIVMTYVAKACLNDQYRLRPPGQEGRCLGSVFAISATEPRTGFSMDAKNYNFSSLLGNEYPLIRSERTICGSTHTGLRTIESMARIETGPSKLDWISFRDGSGSSTALSLEPWFAELLRELHVAWEMPSRCSFSQCLDQMTRQSSWTLSIMVFPFAPHEMKKQRRIRTVRPEAAEFSHEWLTGRALHFWSGNGWSCSGPNAGGGHDADTGLVRPFLFAYSTYMHHIQMSADARVGGVIGRSPPGVQQSEPPTVHKNTNHCGPQPKKGNPQGNPCSSLFHLFNELEILDTMQTKARPAPELPCNFQTRVLGLFVLGLVGTALRANRDKGTPRHWTTIRKCRGQYRRVRRFGKASRYQPQPLTHTLPPAMRVEGRCVPRLARLFAMLIVLGLLPKAQAAPRSRAALQPPRKLAFLRARSLAQSQARVPYRGRLHEAPTLGTTFAMRPTSAPRPKCRLRRSPSGIRIITWNSGGLHTARWAELLQWLQDEAVQQQPVHICFIQETHWPATSEFSDPNWVCIHSGTGTREGGVLTMVSRTTFKDCTVKFAELIAGRMQHVRVETAPPIDLLNIYQYAWNTAKKELQNQLASPEQILLQQRQDVWSGLRSWIASIPKRNSLVIAGDMNASLTPAHPNVGPGTGSMHWHKKDNHSLQAILQTSGLNATNTWRKAGKQSATFLTHKGEGSQIDYIILRNPCNLSRLYAHTLPSAPIIHPTGFRHIPVQCYIPWPSVPKHAPMPVATAATVRRTCERQPVVLENFCKEVAALQCSAEELDQQLSEVWRACQRRAPVLPVTTFNQPEVSLKTYWEAKRHLQVIAEVTVMQCVLSGQASAALVHSSRVTCTGQYLQTALQRWRAFAAFQKQNKLLRKRTRDRKQAKVERQIEEAVEADSKGLTYLYKCMNTLRPKQPKRTIHIKGQDGSMQSDQAEIDSICEYFQHVFSSSTPKVQQEWHLQSHLNISLEEIRDALHSLSAKKALPAGHAPARLWKAGGDTIVRILHEDWSSRFSPGQLYLPPSWNESSTVLIPKPGKPPTSPANLRPISLLPAISKMLARIAANRLRPFLEEAAFQMPQFAYLKQRQTLDSIDRAVAHCVHIRKRIAENRINPFRSKARNPFTGGMQLSLDMAKAFDRMPRPLLLQSLERISTPADLITLIMYVHDNACMQFQRHQHRRVISTGSGVRQGCGLAPLLWVAYSLLLFSKMLSYLHPRQLTGFADDLHMQWSFDTPRHFRNACTQVGLILKDLREAGMQVSSEKTVILLALSGQSYSQDVKPFLRKNKIRQIPEGL